MVNWLFDVMVFNGGYMLDVVVVFVLNLLLVEEGVVGNMNLFFLLFGVDILWLDFMLIVFFNVVLCVLVV